MGPGRRIVVALMQMEGEDEGGGRVVEVPAPTDEEAEDALDRAREIDPNDPGIEELTRRLNSSATGDRSQP